MANSKVKVLEAESSRLRKDLITAMDEGNSSKERIKALLEELRVEKPLMVQKDEQHQSTIKKINSASAKAVRAFKLTDEYNDILFNWYFKGFELLRRYSMKHNPRVNLEDLNFEVVDKEIIADKAAEAIAAARGNMPEAKNDALGKDEPFAVVGDDTPLLDDLCF